MTAQGLIERRTEGRQWAELTAAGFRSAEDANERATEILRVYGKVSYLAFVSGFNDTLRGVAV